MAIIQPSDAWPTPSTDSPYADIARRTMAVLKHLRPENSIVRNETLALGKRKDVILQEIIFESGEAIYFLRRTQEDDVSIPEEDQLLHSIALIPDVKTGGILNTLGWKKFPEFESGPTMDDLRTIFDEEAVKEACELVHKRFWQGYRAEHPLPPEDQYWQDK